VSLKTWLILISSLSHTFLSALCGIKSNYKRKIGGTGVGTGTAEYKFTVFSVVSLFGTKFRNCNGRELDKVTFCLHAADVTSLYI